MPVCAVSQMDGAETEIDLPRVLESLKQIILVSDL